MNFAEYPSPYQVEQELEYLRMEEKDTERILRQAENKREEDRRKRIEWISAFSIAAFLVLLYWYFSGTPSMGPQ